jgi:hypothetical protein
MTKVSGPEVVTAGEALEVCYLRQFWGSWSAPRGRDCWR